MITSDPYGISGAVAPWRSLDAMEPITERRITERERRPNSVGGARCRTATRKELAASYIPGRKGQNRPVICWSAWRWTGMGRRR